MKLGKIDRNCIEDLISSKTGFATDQVLQGPQFGVDTSIIKLSQDKGLVMASDPTSWIPSLGAMASAWLSVVLTANDVATSGYLPQYAQLVLNLPNSMTDLELQAYWEHLHSFCADMGIAITGGHTGFDSRRGTTLSGGITVVAEVDLSLVKSAAFVKPGQDILLTKSAAFSSSAILAKSFPKYVERHLGHKIQQQLAVSFYRMDILPEIRSLQKKQDVFRQVAAMHDVTEGGVLGAVYELCEAGGVGVEINQEAIPLWTGQKQLCELFDIDPYWSLSAGSLLLTCPPEITLILIEQLKVDSIQAQKIGKTLALSEGRKIQTPKGPETLDYREGDPYWHAYFEALEKNLD